ncbi:MAG: hypothetical protein QOJ19_2048 [Acidimicrobiia bacterium]|jgi:hypothetical protein|nr:hypothetical protein [Acidimicrobiia bacterium]
MTDPDAAGTPADSGALPRVEIEGEPVITSRGVDSDRCYWTAHLLGPGGRYLIVGLNGRADIPTPTVIIQANQVAEVLGCAVLIKPRQA